MGLKIGDVVRTKRGTLGEVHEVRKDRIIVLLANGLVGNVSKQNFFKYYEIVGEENDTNV